MIDPHLAAMCKPRVPVTYQRSRASLPHPELAAKLLMQTAPAPPPADDGQAILAARAALAKRKAAMKAPKPKKRTKPRVKTAKPPRVAANPGEKLTRNRDNRLLAWLAEQSKPVTAKDAQDAGFSLGTARSLREHARSGRIERRLLPTGYPTYEYMAAGAEWPEQDVTWRNADDLLAWVKASAVPITFKLARAAGFSERVSDNLTKFAREGLIDRRKLPGAVGNEYRYMGVGAIWPDEQSEKDVRREKAIALHDSGLSWAKVGAVFGVSKATAISYARADK